jgi:multidrug transporter EmrE-like cation transporter
MKTPLSSMALVLLASIVGSFGAVFLKMGSHRLRHGLLHIVSWQSFTGVMLYVLSSVFYVMGVRQGELSVLYPMVALGYIWTLIWSRLFFAEPINRKKVMAIGLILFGIFLIGVGAS